MAFITMEFTFIIVKVKQIKVVIIRQTLLKIIIAIIAIIINVIADTIIINVIVVFIIATKNFIVTETFIVNVKFKLITNHLKVLKFASIKMMVFIIKARRK